MGNMEKSLYRRSSSTQRFQWYTVKQMGLFEVVRDKVTGLQAEKYYRRTHNAKEEHQIYQFRHIYAQIMPKLVSIEQLPTQLSCTFDVEIVVVIERIPFRLMDLGHLDYSEALYILSQSLRGGKAIWERIGSVNYDDSMICFNQEGHAKIWLSQNLSSNTPELRAMLSEKEQVYQIMGLVEARMSGDKFNTYSHHKNRINLNSFQKALKFINIMRSKDSSRVSYIILPSSNEQTQISEKFQTSAVIERMSKVSESDISYKSPQEKMNKTRKQDSSTIKYPLQQTTMKSPKKSLSQKKILKHEQILPINERRNLTKAIQSFKNEKVAQKNQQQTQLKHQRKTLPPKPPKSEIIPQQKPPALQKVSRTTTMPHSHIGRQPSTFGQQTSKGYHRQVFLRYSPAPYTYTIRN